jgi:hypothetical protein
MRKTATLLPLLLMLSAAFVFADESKPARADEEKSGSEKAAKAPEAEESPLVKAAREAKARRDGEKARISITNEDVKKSDGKITQTSTKPLERLPASSDVEKTMRDVAEAKQPRSGRAELQARVAKHQQEVDNLEKELRRIEETYYNEDDPDYREEVLAMRFEDTKRQLETAREQLAAARKALATPAGGN